MIHLNLSQCNQILFLLLTILELTLQFSENVSTGSESLGIVPVALVLVGGTSAIPISVTVIPSDQSPISAEGKNCVS